MQAMPRAWGLANDGALAFPSGHVQLLVDWPPRSLGALPRSLALAHGRPLVLEVGRIVDLVAAKEVVVLRPRAVRQQAAAIPRDSQCRASGCHGAETATDCVCVRASICVRGRARIHAYIEINACAKLLQIHT